ncbi:MAG: molybdopterin-guanine dinucleotide biosynthesis protein B [Pirellulales bacterium]
MQANRMRRLHIVGHKNHGKTSLILDLICEFRLRGFRVGVIKHTSHRHEIDVPGKDSHRQRTAGASPVAILSDGLQAVFSTILGPVDEEARYRSLAATFADCDLVIVEGHVATAGPKLEVWRSDRGIPPMACNNDSILAVVTDSSDSVELAQPVLSRSNIAEIADWIAYRVGLGGPSAADLGGPRTEN